MQWQRLAVCTVATDYVPYAFGVSHRAVFTHTLLRDLGGH